MFLCSFGIELQGQNCPVEVMARSQGDRPTVPRTQAQKKTRATYEKLQRRTGYVLPPHHKFMFQMTEDLQKIKEASERLSRQEAVGIPPVTLLVMGHGATPDTCVASTLPVDLSAPSLQLYQRMCELEAVRERCTETMLQILDVLRSRQHLNEEIVE